jgi:hypothetical protein
MSTNAPSVANTAFQKFIDACIASVIYNGGGAPDAAPSAFKDRLQKTITADETSEFQVVFRTAPGGNGASLKIEAIGSRAMSIEGAVDPVVLAAKLA